MAYDLEAGRSRGRCQHLQRTVLLQLERTGKAEFYGWWPMTTPAVRSPSTASLGADILTHEPCWDTFRPESFAMKPCPWAPCPYHVPTQKYAHVYLSTEPDMGRAHNIYLEMFCSFKQTRECVFETDNRTNSTDVLDVYTLRKEEVALVRKSALQESQF